MTDEPARSDALREALAHVERAAEALIDEHLDKAREFDFGFPASLVDDVRSAIQRAVLAAPAAEPREDGLREAAQSMASALDWLRHGDTHAAKHDLTQALLRIGPPPGRLEVAAAQPGPSEPGLRDLETQLVLRAGHLPTCGEGAEFPWDCTCDYAGFMERMGKVLADADSAPGEGLMDVLLARLTCDDDEEPCDADGRGPHRWCDNCIARAVIAREYAALSERQEDGGA